MAVSGVSKVAHHGMSASVLKWKDIFIIIQYVNCVSNIHVFYGIKISSFHFFLTVAAQGKYVNKQVYYNQINILQDWSMRQVR